MCEQLSYSIQIEARSPVVLAIVGFDPSQRNTVFFDRTYGSEEQPFSGTVVLDFPLPVCPRDLKINVYDRLTGSGKPIQSVKMVAARKLVESYSPVRTHTQAFIQFALGFALQAGIAKAGLYTSADGMYTIKYVDFITALDTGKRIDTPARVNRETGLVYAAKESFDGLTVPCRFFILMHEYVHFANKTEDETECDLLAAKTLLDKGFSQTECLYSVSKLFVFNTKKDVDIQLKQEQRVREVKNFIQNYRAT